ncbi:MAG TPA: hypothetical protein VL996_02245 [Methylocella sp.]|nr:hypothetical protein [Methylocella sp.]
MARKSASHSARNAKALSTSIREIYKWRHLIENFFGTIKEFKRIAMRSDKTDQSYTAVIYAVVAVILSK